MAVWGAIFALTATILGALGAHALKPHLSIEQIESYKTGVQYQFYHALALIIFSFAGDRFSSKWMKTVGYLFIAGIFCFSFSIYLLSTRELTGIEGIRVIGPITPLGGLCFISGWIIALVSFIKK